MRTKKIQTQTYKGNINKEIKLKEIKEIQNINQFV